MGTTRGVIETASGDLIRAGNVQWTTDGSFNGSFETERTDVPTPPRVRGDRPQYHRWNGSNWVLRGDVNRGNRHTISAGPPPKYKISLKGEKVRHMRIVLEKNATVNFLDAPEGITVYLLIVQDATGGRNLTIEYNGVNTGADYPNSLQGANSLTTILMTRFARKLCQVGRSNQV